MLDPCDGGRTTVVIEGVCDVVDDWGEFKSVLAKLYIPAVCELDPAELVPLVATYVFCVLAWLKDVELSESTTFFVYEFPCRSEYVTPNDELEDDLGTPAMVAPLTISTQSGSVEKLKL